MPKAKPISRLGQIESLICELALINTLVKRAGVTDAAQRAKFKDDLDCAIREYRLRVFANRQERPARTVATLEPVLKSAQDLLALLNALPVGVRFELKAGGADGQLEALISNINDRLAYWQQHVAANRPVGQGDASLGLRLSLTAIITAHRPDPPNATAEQKRFKEQRLRDWVAFACREIGARFPHQKKDRRRFIGEHKRPARELAADIYATLPIELRLAVLGLPLASEAERRHGEYR